MDSSRVGLEHSRKILCGASTEVEIVGVFCVIKWLAAKLPRSIQQELKRGLFRWHIWNGTFVTGEAEFNRLQDWVKEGDWVVDVGANVGHYTLRLANIVGNEGRVLAFEPIPWTFELLACNVAALGLNCVTLINAALSDKTSIGLMTVPKFTNGLDNFYEAKLGAQSSGSPVMCLTLDGFQIDQPIKLVKIDAEGHEASALQGMIRMIGRDKPILIVEGIAPEVLEILKPFGYEHRMLPGSPNTVFYIGNSPLS